MGRILISIDDELEQELRKLAESEERSLSRQIYHLLKKAVPLKEKTIELPAGWKYIECEKSQ